MTLAEAAKRFDEAGIAPADEALASLKRCKPGRPPIYRDGDLYALDPHDDEVDLWAFRLGLRPPKAAALRVVRAEPGPLPSLDEPLTRSVLDEAWREGVPVGWSAQRVAICVLDANRMAMSPGDVLAFMRERSEWSRLSPDSAIYWRRGAAIRVRDDGLWELDPGHHALRSARQAIRERIGAIRRWVGARPDPAFMEANRKRFEREREANATRLDRMRRALIYAYPATAPEAVVLLDVGAREMTTFLGGEIVEAKDKLDAYDMIVALDVRQLLRALGSEPGARRIGELGPPQKTMQLNRRGRTLRITTSLLVQGSCGISRPFGDEKALCGYLRDRQHTKLRRRLEADAKSLFALYQYSRLHGAVRLRWGFLDEMLLAPWVHRDEPKLHTLMSAAHALGLPLEIVAGSAPGWADPWSRVRRAHVEKDANRYASWLIGEDGNEIDERDVQLARLANTPSA